jgi:hypothetical protein
VKRNEGAGRPIRWSDAAGRFAITPEWVLLSTAVSGNAVRLYGLLALHANAEGVSFHGRKGLAEQMGVGTTTIDRLLGELKQAGAVTVEAREREDGGRSSNLYVLHATPASPINGDTPPRERVGPHQAHGEGRSKQDSVELDTSTADAVEAGAAVSVAPKLLKIDGQDLALNALAEVCGVSHSGPRVRELATALSGSARTGPGIREQRWRELGCPEIPEAARAGYEHGLALIIGDRAAMYREKMGDALLTPLALAKWWSDLPGMRNGNSGGGLTPADILGLDSDEL